MFADASLITRDGVELVSRLWRPRGDGPWPALLMRQPYGRSIASTVTLPHPDWWCSHGFVVVVQDVRGQGDSGGCFRGFAQEAQDTEDTLTWLRQRPEVNGRIGMYGFSYQGVTQLLAPVDCQPPDCLAPAMCGLNERDHWSCDGNAHWWHLGLGWGLQLASLQARRRGDHQAWDEMRRSLEDGNYLREGIAMLERHDPEGMALRWLRQNPERESDWIQHSMPHRWLQLPMLLLGGWWDPHLRGVIALAEHARAAGGRPELHIGPATHLQWWPESSALLLNFFQRHLITSLSDSAPLQSADDIVIRLWDQVSESWSGPNDLNPASITASSMGSAQTTDQKRWHLCSRGLACLDPEEGQILGTAPDHAGGVMIVHDPWRPVPAIGGHLSPSAGPCDRASLDRRSDVAVFTGAPLESALALNGTPKLKLRVCADQPGFDLCVALSRLPLGTNTVQQLSTGMLRVRGQGALELSARELDLQPLHATLEPGDRLRLSIAGAAWPAIGINPGQPGMACSAPSADCRVISIELHLEIAQLWMLPLLAPQHLGTPAD
ncbi:X-Pro dipeptidyl-peptidase/ S15 family [Synechococcus sp. BIOS-E4-1]|uniref:CocE/NonD family hydrolase n=1 Tax=Synechococcus sp. BIOS-E4-1 TaxID=1400864 RepID=UPI001646C46D|nr:CocE/NonD family hydrolase [Synechococcus sp. BIOS-E4-1]QNI53677.1 X-Pro dipeptidyl-peptidase/ S15 family [Synechococcus sp. BIOS-E4-1]